MLSYLHTIIHTHIREYFSNESIFPLSIIYITITNLRLYERQNIICYGYLNFLVTKILIVALLITGQVKYSRMQELLQMLPIYSRKSGNRYDDY